MKKMKILTVLGVLASAPLIASGPVDKLDETIAEVKTAVPAEKMFLAKGESQGINMQKALKLLDFAYKLYEGKLEKLGYKRDLTLAIKERCNNAKKYSKQMAGKLGIAEEEFDELFEKTETLLSDLNVDNADEMLADISKIALKIPSKALHKKLASAGVDPIVLDVLEIIAEESWKLLSNTKVFTSCCGGERPTLANVLEGNTKKKQASQGSREPVA